MAGPPPAATSPPPKSVSELLNSAIPPQRFYPKTPVKRPARDSAPLPKTTPARYKASGSHPNANSVKDRLTWNRELAKEMKGHFVGPMPVYQFFDEFMKLGDESPECPDASTAWNDVINSSVKSETEMYKPFVKAVKRFSPKMKFFDTHSTGDPNADNLSPDVSGYLADNLPGEGKTPEFSKMSLFVEFKYKVTDDPFVDPKPQDKLDKKKFHFERDTEEHMETRGQFGAYSAAIAGSQFRVHVFSVGICGDTARFICWDRTGAVVSRSFNYIEDPVTLASFFWRYSHISFSEKGHDPTVSKPSAEETADALAAFKDHGYYEYNEFLKIVVPDQDDPDVEKPFLIPPLPYLCHSPFSRATRPTPAYDVTAKSLVFMKDYWRPEVNTKEGDIYTTLHSHNVRHIAKFGMGNDVRKHSTRAQNYAKAKWACHRAPGQEKEPEIPCLKHYRMTLLTVGLPLTRYNCTWEFVSAVADAMEGHDDAYFKAKILHRDVSVANILLTSDGGILIDWDMSLSVDQAQTSARRPKRTGTWQFMSSKLLDDPNWVQNIMDDRESAFYVLLWTALRYTERWKVNENGGRTIPLVLLDFDEAYIDTEGNIRGGGQKSNIFIHNRFQITFDTLPHLDGIIEELRYTFYYRYLSLPKVEGKRRQDALKLQEEAFKDLESEGWLVAVMRKYLEQEGWPKNDAAVRQDTVIQTSTAHKRKLQQGAVNKVDMRAKRSKTYHTE